MLVHPDEVQFIGHQLQCLLHTPPAPLSPSGEPALSLREAYDKLCSLVKSLPEVPLAITSMQPIHPGTLCHRVMLWCLSLFVCVSLCFLTCTLGLSPLLRVLAMACFVTL